MPKPDAADASRAAHPFRLRTITAFVELPRDDSKWAEIIGGAGDFLRSAQEHFVSAGELLLLGFKEPLWEQRMHKRWQQLPRQQQQRQQQLPRPRPWPCGPGPRGPVPLRGLPSMRRRGLRSACAASCARNAAAAERWRTPTRC
jgi:hypothetical protein